jgi:hypothetical protein
MTVISGLNTGVGAQPSYAYQQAAGTVFAGNYAGMSHGDNTHYTTDIGYWYAQYGPSFGEAVLTSSAYLNASAGSLKNLFGGGVYGFTPWVDANSDGHRSVLDSMAYRYTPGTFNITAGTHSYWTAAIWGFNGFSGSDWSTSAPGTYYKMFIEQFYPNVVAISGGF